MANTPSHSVIHRLLAPLGFLLVLCEEAFWALGRVVGAVLARIPFWRAVERLVESLPPRAVVVVFLFPMVALFPLKLLALGLMTQGHVVWGLLLVVGAKVVGTAVAARLFVITRPKLMTIPWFAASYTWVTTKMASAHAWVEAMPAWQATRAWGQRVRGAARASVARLRGWLATRKT